MVIQCRHLGYKVQQTLQESEPLTILSDIDLMVERGQNWAIVGPSGSGKSTLLALMAGLDVPTQGEVRLFGQSLVGLSEDERAAIRAQRVGFVFQNFQLQRGISVLDNVRMPLELFGFDRAVERSMTILEQVGMIDHAYKLSNQLSGGEQQRVAVARALVTEPELIFADEPTGNLDEANAEKVQQLLLSLVKPDQPNSPALVVVTHDNQFAQACQYQCRLRQGRLESGVVA